MDLVGSRGNSESARQQSFRDCLQTGERQPPLCPAIEPGRQQPAANDNRPTQAETDPPASEPTASQQVSDEDVISTDEAEDEEQIAVEQAAPLVQSPLLAAAGEEVLALETATELNADSLEPTDEPQKAVPSSPTAATTDPTVADGAQAESALNPAVPADENTSVDNETTAPVNLERQAADAGASRSPGDAAERDAAQRSSKTGIPKGCKPEHSGVLDPPKIPPLDPPQAEDSSRSSTGETPSAPSFDENAAAATAIDAMSAMAAVDTSSTAAHSSAPDALPGIAASSKPPAAFVKSASGTEEAAPRPGEVDPARFLQRVVKAFESAHQRDGEVRLRLHPAELGALSIEVKVQDSVLTARVQAETLEARATIVDNLPALRERLAEQGIRIERFDVDLMDHSDHRQQSLDEQNRQREARQAAALRNPGRQTNSAGPTNAPKTRQHSAVPGGLNVII